MKTKVSIGILVSFLVISVVAVALVAAKPDNPGQGEKPAKAGRPEKLKQIIFVHPVAPDKPDHPGKGKKPKPPLPDPVNDYFELWGGYLASTLDYCINPNVGLVAGEDAAEAVQAAAEAWDAVTTTTDLFNYAGTTEKSWYQEDGENTVSWVKFFPRDYIAMVVMWYDDDKVIWEFDIVFNAFHKWGIDPIKEDEDKIKAFDIQNIATHEFGHPVGLDDLYLTEYRELTMYGYSSKGETQKCSLEEGDIAGAQEPYGAP